MRSWQLLLKLVLETGESRPDRTGVGTWSLFGQHISFPNNGPCFPAVTTKKLAIKQVAAELKCFIEGYEDLDSFHQMGCTIWDGNGKSDYWKPRWEGDLGRIYGVQWRNWLDFNSASTDQLAKLIDGLKKDPMGRRHIVTAWNPGELDVMCLPPCHIFFQCYVSKNGYMDLHVYMRSVDLFLGLPFDIASYAILQRLIAKEVGLLSRKLYFSFGDAHVYHNHKDAVQEVLKREPRAMPAIELHGSLFNFEHDRTKLLDYEPWPAVEAKLNV